MRKLRNIIVGLAIAVVVTTASALPANAGTIGSWKSSIDMNTACAQQWPGTVAGLVSYNGSGWRCGTSWSAGPVVIGTINLNKYCGDRWGTRYVAYNPDMSNPYSWGCYRYNP